MFQPIYFPKNDKNGTILNVEEKKAKDRSSYGGGGSGRISMDNNGGQRSRDNNGPRRGGGGQGPPRGGSGNMSGSGNRPNNFNRGQTVRVPNNTYNNRR